MSSISDELKVEFEVQHNAGTKRQLAEALVDLVREMEWQGIFFSDFSYLSEVRCKEIEILRKRCENALKGGENQ